MQSCDRADASGRDVGRPFEKASAMMPGLSHWKKVPGKPVIQKKLARADQAAQARGSSPECGRTAEATITAEPLERGFGVTLGNALRRILLSSLQGSAITAVQIDSVLHEFSTRAGCARGRHRHRAESEVAGASHAQRNAKAHVSEGEGTVRRDRRHDRGRPRRRDHGSAIM